jgi:hypothetical protein
MVDSESVTAPVKQGERFLFNFLSLPEPCVGVCESDAVACDERARAHIPFVETSSSRSSLGMDVSLEISWRFLLA